MSLTLMLESIVAQFNWHLYNIFNWDYQIELVIVFSIGTFIYFYFLFFLVAKKKKE